MAMKISLKFMNTNRNDFTVEKRFEDDVNLTRELNKMIKEFKAKYKTRVLKE